MKLMNMNENVIRAIWRENADILNIAGMAARIGCSRTKLNRWLRDVPDTRGTKAKLSEAELSKLESILKVFK